MSLNSVQAIRLVGLLLPLSGVLGCAKDKPKAEQTVPATSTQAVSVPSAPKSSYPALPEAPKSLGPLRVPESNPLTPAKVALGHKLFFDKRLSVDGSRACYSCHLNEDGTGGHDPIAIGAGDKPLTRHAPVMWNVGYLPAYYWDGRADSLEAQAVGAWAGGNMGVGKEGLAKKADEIGLLAEYKTLFADAFPGEGSTPETIAQALASYQRTLFCGDTAYDKFAAGDKSALTPAQQKGFDLFAAADKGNCASCHTPPFFSDAYMAPGGAYHNTGIGHEGKAADAIDAGRGAVTKAATDQGAFKTPTLRNVSKSAPYFHDGSIATLEAAVKFMASGGFPNKNLDDKLVKLAQNKLSDEEIGLIVDFLRALDCEGKLAVP